MLRLDGAVAVTGRCGGRAMQELSAPRKLIEQGVTKQNRTLPACGQRPVLHVYLSDVVLLLLAFLATQHTVGDGGSEEDGARGTEDYTQNHGE